MSGDDKRLADMLQDLYRFLTPEASRALARQVNEIVNRGKRDGWDFTELVLVASGAARTQLIKELRELREQAGLTQRDVATRSHCSLSKVVRIENGINHISYSDLRHFLNLYNAAPEVRHRLVGVWEQQRQR